MSNTTAALDMSTVRALMCVDHTLGKHITWVDDDGELHGGTVRHLCDADDSPAYPKPGQDVRDTYVRITRDSGWEMWIWTLELGRMLLVGTATEDKP